MTEERPADGRSSGDGYQVVARRYRPQSFETLVGQSHVAQALGNAIKSDRVGHAYLFTGARGVGKTSTARIFAKALDCVTGPTIAPCNECDICQSIATGEDMDVLEIDGASNRGIDEIRQLRSNVNVRPSRARFKIYIIDEVHMLTKEAFNALLKTLEEPPAHVKFIFCTTDPEKLPITVRSRCQRFDFAPVRTHEIAERLSEICQTEGLEAEPAALQALARRAAGSMRDSQSLLEQLFAFCDKKIAVDDVYRLLGTARGGTLLKLVGLLRQGDAAAALEAVQQAVAEGVEAGQLAEQLLGIYRDLCVLAVGGSRELLSYLAFDEFDEAERIAKEAGLDNLAAAMQIVDQAAGQMRLTTYPRIQLELALLRVCRLPDLASLSEAIARLEKKTDRRSAEGVSERSAPRPTAPSRPAPAVLRQDPKEQATPAEPKAVAPASTSRSVAQPESRRDAERPEDETRSAAAGQEAGPAVMPARAAMAGEGAGPTGEELTAKKPLLPDEMTDAKAEELWREAVALLNDSTGECASDFSAVAWRTPSRLVVKLRGSYNYERCVRKSPQLEAAFEAVSGLRAHLSLECDPDAPAAPSAPAPKSRKQREQELRQQPMIAAAIAEFQGEIISIDDPSPRDS
ncbi:MAG TPA: DNA polymerase III subunit gamma/tau [Pirellulaceae bacterium]|jgi:DNA polymerase-3 subunit gamma/tau|nr:DNA polymerase III subunit gamma/tau [Pirellulaceae bacterium]